MNWKRIVAAVAVACVAFPASGNWNRAYAEVSYTGDNDGCYILGSPSNDFFCTEWDEFDIGSDGGLGGSGEVGAGETAKTCGRNDKALCGGTNVHKTFVRTCTEWRITSANGTVSLTAFKPSNLGLGYTSECSSFTEVTTEITSPNRWDI